MNDPFSVSAEPTTPDSAVEAARRELQLMLGWQASDGSQLSKQAREVIRQDASAPIFMVNGYSFVTSLGVARLLGVRHDNMSRAWNSCRIKHPADFNFSVAVHKCHVVQFVPLRVIEFFIEWSVQSAPTKQQKKLRQEAFQVYTTPVERREKIVFPAPKTVESPVVLGGVKFRKQEHPIPASTDDSVTALDNLTGDVLTRQEASALLGCTERHMMRVLADLQAKASPDVLPLLVMTPEGKLPHSAVVLLALMTGKARPARFSLFSRLLAGLATPKPAVPALPSNVPNFLDPAAAARAWANTYESTLKMAALRGKTQEELDREQRAHQVTHRVLSAELAGAKLSVEEMKHAVTSESVHGALVNHPLAEETAISAYTMRSKHNCFTVTDLVSMLAEPDLGKPNDYLAMTAANFHSMGSPPWQPGDRARSPSRMIVWWACHKYTRADGQPVLRKEIAEMTPPVALVRKVYVSSASSDGNRQKHGVERRWRWCLWFTPAALDYLRKNWQAIQTAWILEGEPKHMRSQVKS